jgi:retinol dehydrogenase 14
MDLIGKTVVVTGGTSGIGRATALALAARGADVTVIGRDPGRGADVEQALKQASGGRGRFVTADLSLIADARRIVTELLAYYPRLDALILSAGVIEFERATTSEGLDRQFVINFLHKLVLADGLEPSLRAARGRVVVVAAKIPDRVAIDWTNFEGARSYAGVMALPRLHGASLAVVQRLAADWKAAGIEVTAIHPGQVDTGIFRGFSGAWRVGQWFMRLFQVPVEKPAALLSWLAFSPDAAGLTGQLVLSVKNYEKRRVLARDPGTLERVMSTARSVAASV